MYFNLVCKDACAVLVPRVGAWSEISVLDRSLCCSQQLGHTSRMPLNLHQSSREQAMCLHPDTGGWGQSPTLLGL